MLPGFKELLIGDGGVGKTHVLRTLLAHGIQPYVLATEPGMRALAPCENTNCAICATTRTTVPAGSIPYRYVEYNVGGIDLLIKQAGDVNTKNQSQLAKIEDGQRKDYFQFGDVLQLTKRFVDSDGVDHGLVSEWNTDRAFVLDSSTELANMAMAMYVGRRPVYDKPDYQVAQRMVYNYIHLLTNSFKCHVIVLGHPDKVFNEAVGVTSMTLQTVGQKLSPQLPRKFDDVIIAKRNGDKFEWSTAEFNSEGKGRNLPTKTGLKPDFGQVVEAWKRGGGKIEKTVLTQGGV